MDHIKESTEGLLKHEICKKWPELKEALIRSTAREPFSWKLPVVACEAVGGESQDTLPALAAFTCIHIGIRLIDDLLDEDARLESVEGNLARTANLAIAFNALSQDYLLSDKNDPRAAMAMKELGHMQLVLAYGQDLDAQNLGNEESYWEIAHAKSGVYFASALCVGAIYGGASSSLAEKMREFGIVYGEIMQIHDDLNDTLDEAVGPDWEQGRYPLPILFAEIVEHPDQARFIELREDIHKKGALKEAQEILVRCGAISYAVNELMLRHEKAQGLLDDLALKKPEVIQALLDEVMEPVEHLFKVVGGGEE